MVTRAQMSIRTRALLIGAARELFAERPYAQTTLGDIAAAAGLTKGALYHHYASKEDLLKAVQEDTYDQVIAQSEHIAAQGLCPIDEVRALLVLHLKMVVAHRATLPATIPQSPTSGQDGWSKVREKRDRIEAFVVDAIKRGMAAGDFTGVDDPRLTAYLLLGSCYWTVRWFRSGGRWNLDEVADHLVAVSLYGLAGRPTI